MFNPRFIYIIILFIFSPFHLFSQLQQPKLIVGIMIDGLQPSHIEKIRDNLETNGFKRFFDEGVVFNDICYNQMSAGSAADVASLMTGTVPYYHGITGNYRYDRIVGNVQSVLQDDGQTGIGTTVKYSAHNLLSSTFADELKMFYYGRPKFYVVAIQPECAIMMGGHTANSVAWIDDVNMKWVTTGYYTDGLNRNADEMNVSGSFKRLVTRKWEPLFPLNFYHAGKSQTGNKNGNFSYDPTDRFTSKLPETLLKKTPAANSLVTELAGQIVNSENLGYDNEPDVLMLQYTVKTPGEKINSLDSNEKEDIYYRLDKEIQLLIEQIDRKAGKTNVLYFLFSNQTDSNSPNELGDNKIPAGYFSANRSMALLNSYLMALYGQEKWIDGYFGKNIYLNRSKIAEKRLNLREIQKSVCDFMLEFEGVQTAYISSDLFTMAGPENSSAMKIRNSVHKNNIGDITITLMPGWLEFDDKLGFTSESSSVKTRMPFYMYGWKVKPQVINNSYFVTDIAPTLSNILKIPYPNGNTGKVIQEMNY